MNRSKLWLLVRAALPAFLGVQGKKKTAAPAAPLLGQGGRSFSLPKRRGKVAGKVLLVILAVYFLALSTSYSFIMADALAANGGDLRAVPTIMMVAASLLILITGIYSGGKALFKYKDYEMVMSLPVSVATVAASRMLMLYLYELLFTVVLMLPAGVVYYIKALPSPLFIPLYLIGMLLTPLIPLIISSILGTLATALSSRFKKLGTLMNILFTLVFMGVVFVASFTLGSSSGNDSTMAAGLSGVTAAMSSRWPPARLFIRAVCDLDWLAGLLFAVLSLALFALFCILIARSYRSLCSRVSGTSRRSGRKTAGRLREASPLKTLYRRELGRYFSSAIYVTNTMVGLLLDVVVCILVLVAPGNLGQAVEALSQYPVFYRVLPLLIAMFVSLSCTTCSSISLEGRQIWIVKTSPIRAMDLYKSKIAVNLTLTVPVCLICSTLLAVAFRLSAADTLLIYVVPLVYALFSAVFGLVINLMLPKLEWTNEAMVVKQSAAAMVAMFGGMVLTMVVMILVVLLGNLSHIIYLGTTALVLVVTLLLYLHLRRRGEALLTGL